jgi:hypothetical protein
MPRVGRRARATSALARYGASGRRIAKAFSYVDSQLDQRLIGYFLWADPARTLGLFVADHRNELAHCDTFAPLDEYLAALRPACRPCTACWRWNSDSFWPTTPCSIRTRFDNRVSFPSW